MFPVRSTARERCRCKRIRRLVQLGQVEKTNAHVAYCSSERRPLKMATVVPLRPVVEEEDEEARALDEVASALLTTHDMWPTEG